MENVMIDVASLGIYRIHMYASYNIEVWITYSTRYTVIHRIFLNSIGEF